MKQSFRRKKTVAIYGSIAASILLLCVVFSVVFALRQNSALLLVLLFPALLGILFAIIALIEYRGSIEIDDQKVKFNYRLFSKTKELNKSGVEIPFSQIEAITKAYRPGDGIVGSDCFLYTIHLTGKKQAEVYLYHFSKAEDHIFKILCERVRAKRVEKLP